MPTVVRHVTPIAPDAATGLVARIYDQVSRDFSGIGPAVQMLTPADEIAAASWALLREAQLAAGKAPLAAKIMVALGVAQGNRCGYDEAAFLAMLRMVGMAEAADAIASGGVPTDPELAGFLQWGRSTAARPPRTLTGHREELIGTALFSHFVQRIADAMLPPGLHPGTLRETDEPPFEGAPVFRSPKPVEPGDSLDLLGHEPVRTLPTWAPAGAIGTAYAALAARAAQGAGLLSDAAAKLATDVIASHHGRRVRSGTPWETELSALDDTDRHGAELAVLAGLAPERITDARVLAWRATDQRFSDHCTVYLLSFGAMAAVERIEADL